MELDDLLKKLEMIRNSCGNVKVYISKDRLNEPTNFKIETCLITERGEIFAARTKPSFIIDKLFETANIINANKLLETPNTIILSTI